MPAVLPRVELVALRGVPTVEPGMEPWRLVVDALDKSGRVLEPGDVLVVSSKLVSRAEGRFVDLSEVEPGPPARELAARTRKDPALVELILREASSVSRAAPDVLVVRHRLGFVCANAGIDASNAQPGDAAPGTGPWVLLLPEDPDGSAAGLRAVLHHACGVEVGVILSDSFGRPFRLGTVGVAIGSAGIPALVDHRGRTDRHGRVLQHTFTALADQLAAAADLLAGQADEGTPLVLVRGLALPASASTAADLARSTEEDLYA